MQYEPVIGLEVHAQLKTQTKIFCGCPTAFGALPNTQVCPVCLGMPGVLPVLNRKVVDFALRMALATGCTIARQSRFARKNYFYPDLPKGYQISQYELPIATNGQVQIQIDGQTHRIGITRIHMEEDAGKLNHDPHRPLSLVDLNRTGVPLIEIVSEPDLRTPEQAGEYLRKLRAIVRYLGICDGNLEEGSFRCDANVSVRPVGSAALGTRTELKNLNSFRFVEKAIAYEITRQIALVAEGAAVVQETRLWDADKNRSFPMRGKEEAHDYRYFPDPDLLPLIINEKWIEAIARDLPELPDAKRRRFIQDHHLPAYDADILTASKELADYFEDCLKVFPRAKAVSNWIMGPILGLLNTSGQTINQIPIPPLHLGRLLAMVDKGLLSGKIAKTVFDDMAHTGRSPDAVVAEKGLGQVSDTAALDQIVKGVLAENPAEVVSYRSGKTKLLGFFVGQVMKKTKGQANPQMVNDLIMRALSDQ
jgi:aspartyl-tRNA(Asn)/glutamyl-tRNA(Gln) amidotransferase subunit B